MLIILFIILNNSIILRSYKNYCKSPQFLCQKITPPSTALSFKTHPTVIFVLFPPTKPPPNKNIPYWSCLPWTPSLTLPPSSLKCWQKSNPGIHRQCFRCFKCFGCFRCFISLLDHKTARFWSKSELNPQIGTHPPPPSNGCGKLPKKQFTHRSTNTILSCKL